MLPLLAASLLTVSAGQAQMPAPEVLDAEARTILRFQDDTLRKWRAAPRILYLGLRPDDPALARTVEMLSEDTGHALTVTRLDPTHAMTREGLRDYHLFARRRSEDGSLQLFLDTPEGEIPAEIFVFSLPVAQAAFFLLKIQLGTVDRLTLEKSYLRNPGACFFSMLSRPEGLAAAFVFIDPDLDLDLDDAYHARCIHEELYQTMGLPNDSEGSEWFNFDDLALSKDPRWDRALVRWLYQREIVTGTPLDAVTITLR
ncbi:DUF2927 domain-containing protein [Jannaschia sp.]|nr:DUF2927 domain-containing protein [Jannaschia sp.]